MCVYVFYISASSQQSLPLPWDELLFILTIEVKQVLLQGMSCLGLLKAKEIKTQINTCAS